VVSHYEPRIGCDYELGWSRCAGPALLTFDNSRYVPPDDPVLLVCEQHVIPLVRNTLPRLPHLRIVIEDDDVLFRVKHILWLQGLRPEIATQAGLWAAS
jgi:hypothetical protein